MFSEGEQLADEQFLAFISDDTPKQQDQINNQMLFNV